MSDLVFDELQARLQSLYQAGEYAGALDLARQQAAYFPEQAPLLSYWQIALSARLGDEAQALVVLREALQKGFWYGETLLRKSPSFQTLQGLPEFERLVQLNLDLQGEDRDCSYPLLILRSEGRCKAGGDACPLLIGLHANASKASNDLDLWRPAASAGWLVAAPQSSQAMWKGAYNWNDQQAAEREIVRQYHALVEKYSIDARKVVLTGHGQGGELAAGLVLSGAIKAAGFIAVVTSAAFMQAPDEWAALIRQEHASSLRAGFLLSDEVRASQDKHFETLSSLLSEAGISCQVGDMLSYEEPALLKALSFIVSNS